MNQKSQMWGAWCGLICLAFFFTGVVVFCRLLPPPIGPNTTAEELVKFYGQNQFGFLLGTVFLISGGALLLPFAGSIAVQLKKIEGQHSMLMYTFLLAAALVSIEIIIPAWMFATLGFSTHTPDVTHALSDMAWLMFVWPNTVTMVMAGSLGFAVLTDANPTNIFPRWVGFINVAMVLLYIPSNFTVLFKSGLVAWNGLLPFWVPAAEFGSWILIMFFALRIAIKVERQLPTMA